MKDLPVCIFCGVSTDHWWYLDGKNNVCRCLDCLENDMADTEQERLRYSQFLAILLENQKFIEKPSSPISEVDRFIWEQHIAVGSERLRKWAIDGARYYKYGVR